MEFLFRPPPSSSSLSFSFSLSLSPLFQPPHPLFLSRPSQQRPSKRCGQKTLKTVVRFVRSRLFRKKEEEKKAKESPFFPSFLQKKRSEIKTYTFVHRSAAFLGAGCVRSARKREREESKGEERRSGKRRESQSSSPSWRRQQRRRRRRPPLLALFSSMPSLFLSPASRNEGQRMKYTLARAYLEWKTRSTLSSRSSKQTKSVPFPP